MISFGSVSSAVYPEIRAVHVNDAGDWSETTLIHESFSYACFTSPSKERWGDYTGTVRKHNASEPTVWINGMYGTVPHRWNTWIAELTGEYTAGTTEESLANEVSIAPNPVVETFVMKFDMAQDVPVNIQVMGIDGKVVKQLYNGIAYAGHNQFAFNKANLASGTYFVQVVSTDNEIIANEKIIIR